MSAPTVAALYVDPNGVYANLPGVEVWDEARDARLYAGPWPVVAHPPCNRWGQLARVNNARHGTPLGEDGGCFAAALQAVRTWGGVLEHPAHTLAWKVFGLSKPLPGCWMRSFMDDGYVTEVAQVAYGHPARKRTWLYYVGPEPPELDPLTWRVHELIREWDGTQDIVALGLHIEALRGILTPLSQPDGHGAQGEPATSSPPELCSSRSFNG